MRIKILSTSDVHGYLQADDFRRPLTNQALGLEKAATVLKSETEQDDQLVIRIENGDFIQGSPFMEYLTLQPVTQTRTFFNQLSQALQYDVHVLGNHEFNYGRTYLEQVLQDLPVLNANILDETTQRPFLGEPYRIFKQHGYKVGVIGLTTKFIPHWETAEHIQGLVFADPVDVAKQYIQELKPQVDVIVIAYHGGFAEDLTTGEKLERVTGENQGYQLLQLSDVDALVTGHQHRRLAEVVAGVPTTQPGYRGEDVGAITLDLNTKHQVIDADAQLLDSGHAGVDEKLHTLTQIKQAKVNNWLDQPVGHVGHNMLIHNHKQARLYGHPFVELVNQVQMAYGQTQIANTALFNNEVRGLDDMVTRRDVMTNYIYPNTLVVERLSGQDIKDALEVSARYFQVNSQQELIINPLFLHPKTQHYNYDLWSGIEYTLDLSQPMNQRVQKVTVQGQPLDLKQKYEVALNSYRAGGAGNYPMYRPDKIVREVQQSTSELIINYLVQHPQLEISQPHNITTIGYQQVQPEE